KPDRSPSPTCCSCDEKCSRHDAATSSGFSKPPSPELSSKLPQEFCDEEFTLGERPQERRTMTSKLRMISIGTVGLLLAGACQRDKADGSKEGPSVASTSQHAASGVEPGS